MREPIKFEEGIGSVKFAPDLPTNLVWVKGKDVRHARIEPDDYRPRPHSYPEICKPNPVLPINHHIQAPLRLPVDKTPKGNRRIYCGKIPLQIPDGFSPGPIEEFRQFGTGIKQSRKCSIELNEKHLNDVVARINQQRCNTVRQGDLTYFFRNKKMRAKDIENVLTFLIDRGALKKLDINETPIFSLGGRPSQEYFVLWGASEFFPQKPQQDTEETPAE